MDNTNVSKHLGQKSEYKFEYDSSLLVREPRSSNRIHLNIDNNNLPFVGYDVWNGWELSWLSESGQPYSGIIKIVYPATNEYIVESKSLKLYLNSFNMYKIPGGGFYESSKNLSQIIKQDLEKLLECKVDISVHNCDQAGNCKNYYNFLKLEDIYSNVVCTEYNENPEILRITQGRFSQRAECYSSLLRSRCRVTGQPDYGDVYIQYKGNLDVTGESLLRYIVSFRNECHFHEEICETIYKRLWDKLSPEELMVTCFYTRRGGIDINPTRVSHDYLLSQTLIDSSRMFVKSARQ